jgi:hypothetical protein
MSKINKILNTIDFIEYISKSMEKEDLLLLYKINNITQEKLELFSDFTYSLNELIITTYLGDDITNNNEKNNHFKWCWDKVISSFKEERIYFIEAIELQNYFKEFYKESFYEEEDKTKDSIYKIGLFWEDLFDYKEPKTMSEYETLLELYKIFNKSFMVN